MMYDIMFCPNCGKEAKIKMEKKDCFDWIIWCECECGTKTSGYCPNINNADETLNDIEKCKKMAIEEWNKIIENTNYEISFKAKGKDRWVIGLPIYDTNGSISELEVYNGFSKLCYYAIDSDTICRSTGHKDKNNKMIWENDIVRIEKKDSTFEICKVVWVKEDAAFMYEIEENVYYGLGLFKQNRIEVIGNIFDDVISGERK